MSSSNSNNIHNTKAIENLHKTIKKGIELFGESHFDNLVYQHLEEGNLELAIDLVKRLETNPFDKKVIRAEFIRNGLIDWMGRHRKKEYCTLKNSINVCCIKVKGKRGNYYNKWPKLMELHKHLFRSVPNNLHNSLVDIFVCLRCFHKLYYDKDILRTGKELREYYDELCGFANKYKL